MPHCITSSAKTLTLAIPIIPFLFILVGVLCGFAMKSGMFILLYPQEEEVHASS